MPSCLTTDASNQKLDAILAELSELIGWADADAEHAMENDARETARDDFRRATQMRKAKSALEAIERDVDLIALTEDEREAVDA